MSRWYGPYKNSENSVQRMTLILGVNIPWGMTKRSISSPSPNSLSFKIYEVHMIRDTKLRSHDERPKILISQLNWSFLVWFFYTWIASLSSTRCLWHLFFPTFFFLASFCQNVDLVFLEIAIILPPLNKKKKATGNRFVLFWGRSTQIFRSKIAKLSGKTPASTPSCLQLGQLV